MLGRCVHATLTWAPAETVYSVNQNELSISQVRHYTSAGDPNVKQTGPCPQFGAQWKKQARQQVREVGLCSLSGAWLTLAKAVGDAQADWVGEHTPQAEASV